MFDCFMCSRNGSVFKRLKILLLPSVSLCLAWECCQCRPCLFCPVRFKTRFVASALTWVKFFWSTFSCHLFIDRAGGSSLRANHCPTHCYMRERSVLQDHVWRAVGDARSGESKSSAVQRKPNIFFGFLIKSLILCSGIMSWCLKVSAKSTDRPYYFLWSSELSYACGSLFVLAP